MTTTRPELEQRLLAALDAIDEPISIGAAIRDRDGRILDSLREVVEGGQPYARAAALVADTVTGGSWVGGMDDLRATRLADGYLSTWRLREASPEPG